VAKKWISLGYKVSLVLRIIGIGRSTYYANLNRQPKTKTRAGGRPRSRYTLTNDNKLVRNEQIKEWLCELITAEGAYSDPKRPPIPI